MGVWTSMNKLKMAQYKWDKQNLVLIDIQWTHGFSGSEDMRQIEYWLQKNLSSMQVRHRELGIAICPPTSMKA